MRTLNTGMHRFTEIIAIDEPGEGGACHHYEIIEVGGNRVEFGYVQFQQGPVKEVGVNGCFIEDLIVICVDQLREFQASKFTCEENRQALMGLAKALEWLDIRTTDRRERGVEGKNEK